MNLAGVKGAVIRLEKYTAALAWLKKYKNALAMKDNKYILVGIRLQISAPAVTGFSEVEELLGELAQAKVPELIRECEAACRVGIETAKKEIRAEVANG